MKKLVLIIGLVLTALWAQAQNEQTVTTGIAEEVTVIENPTPTSNPIPDLSQAYKNTAEWGKYKVLRAIGWSCLGVGVAAGVTGPFIMIVNHEMSPNPTPWVGATIWGTGIALTAASIPLLIVAYHYRSKAKKMNFSVGMAPLEVPSYNGRFCSLPAFNLSLTF